MIEIGPVVLAKTLKMLHPIFFKILYYFPFEKGVVIYSNKIDVSC